MSTIDPEFNSSTVPAFLTKLRLLVNDEDTNDLIYWDRDGASFHICDGNRLAKEILPLFFKHNNLSSFIRQLNMYGFRKVNRIDPTAAFKNELEDMEFKHPYFLRDKPHMMCRIQRKPHTNVSSGLVFNGRATTNSPMSSYLGSAINQSIAGMHNRFGAGPSPELERLYIMIRGLRANQDTMANQLSILQSENQLLYRELSELRDRHEQQSQLIQTLFTFLSAFAKDSGQAPNFRFGPNKRRALPFTPSNMFATSTHSGLKLNLPKGFDLNDYTKTVHPLQLTTSDEALPTPYKIARVDFRALPTNVPEITHRLSPSGTEVPGQSPHIDPSGKQLQPIAGTSQQQQLSINATNTLPHPTTHRMLAKSNRAHPEVKRIINFLARQNEQNSIIAESLEGKDALRVYGATRHVTSPGSAVDSATASNPIIFTPDEQDSYCIRPDVKPLIPQEEDLTMTSLTHASSNTASAAATSPLVTMSEATAGNVAPALDDSGDSQLIDLNLSRCTTPISLIQPDSVDLNEFLAAARADDESEISMDDLFLASAALESSSTKGELQPATLSCRAKANEVEDLSFETNNSQDGDAAISLPDVCAEEVVASGTEKDPQETFGPIDTADLDQITLDPISDCASVTTTDSVNQRSTSKPISSTLNTPSHCASRQQNQQLTDRELFGLPWEDGLMDGVASAEEEECNGYGDVTESFNAGLLPTRDCSPNTRLKQLTRHSLESIKSGARRSKNNQPESFIVGNEIIPAEAAAPFANVSVGNLVQILQPTLVPVSAVRQSSMSTNSIIIPTDTSGTVHALNPLQTQVSTANPISTASPPLMRSRLQSRPIATFLTHADLSNNSGGVVTTNAIGATRSSVSSAHCMIPVLPLTTVSLGQPLLAAQTRPITWTLPASTPTTLGNPRQSVRTTSVRPAPARTQTVYKKIAPAPPPITKSPDVLGGTGSSKQQANTMMAKAKR